MIKASGIKTFIVSNLVLGSNTISSYFFLFFLIIDLYILISGVALQIFIPTLELAIPSRTPINEANAEIKTHPVTTEIKKRECLK